MIAVDPTAHRRGIGTALVDAITTDLRADGVHLFQVRTVGPSFPSEHYGRTREFYLSRGFLPLEEFDRIDWDGPTLILVMAL